MITTHIVEVLITAYLLNGQLQMEALCRLMERLIYKLMHYLYQGAQMHIIV
jgi:hypothetical protein